MIIDTDILIWALRGEKTALSFLETVSSIEISDITYAELIQGTKNKNELRAVQRFLSYIKATKLSIDTDISTLALQLIEQYFHSHSLYCADAYIAATALSKNSTLASGNRKHFEYTQSSKLFRNEEHPCLNDNEFSLRRMEKCFTNGISKVLKQVSI